MLKADLARSTVLGATNGQIAALCLLGPHISAECIIFKTSDMCMLLKQCVFKFPKLDFKFQKYP